MITIKTEENIEKMKEAGKIVADAHKMIKKIIKPGITTMEINKKVDKFIRARGGIPAQIGYQGYPYAICASINDEVCHGMPRDEALEEGDILTVDMVVEKDGWMADSAWSYAIGEISPEAKDLMETTKESLYKGIEKAIVGNRLGDIGSAIQEYVEDKDYSVVRMFVGHGIGREMHEAPQVLHYGEAGRGKRLTEGMTLTIEPMINIGHWDVEIDEEDGWTARTKDGSLSCQYEHTLAITKDGPIILTDQND